MLRLAESFVNCYTRDMKPSKLEILLNAVEYNGLKFLILEDNKEYNWQEAKVYAASLGGRLPTIEELKAAYASGLRFKEYTWSGTVRQDYPSFSYSFSGTNGDISFDRRSFGFAVCCVLLTEDL